MKRTRWGLGLAAALALMVGLATGLGPTAGVGAQEPIGSITATVYGCPLGVTAETATPDACALLTEGVGVNIVSTEADIPVRPLTDATFDGASFVWTGLLVPKNYRIDVARPAGSPYASHVVVGEGVDQTTLTLTLDAPDAVVTIYNFASGEPTAEFFDLPIVKITCTALPEGVDLTIAFHEPTETCDPGPGVTFTVTDAATGEALGSCVTGIGDTPEPVTAGCSVSIPFGTSVIITEDVSTAPAGYLPEHNDIPFTAPDAPPDGITGGGVFINVLQDDEVLQDEDEAPDDVSGVVTLPSTGAGPAAVPGAGLGGVLAGAILALAGATIGLRWSPIR